MNKELLNVPIIQVSPRLHSDSHHLFLAFSLQDGTKRKSHGHHPIIFLLNIPLITVIEPRRSQQLVGSQEKSRQYKNSLLDQKTFELLRYTIACKYRFCVEWVNNIQNFYRKLDSFEKQMEFFNQNYKSLVKTKWLEVMFRIGLHTIEYKQNT